MFVWICRLGMSTYLDDAQEFAFKLQENMPPIREQYIIYVVDCYLFSHVLLQAQPVCRLHKPFTDYINKLVVPIGVSFEVLYLPIGDANA